MRQFIGRTLLITLSITALTSTIAQDTVTPAVPEATAAETDLAEFIEIVPFAERIFLDRAALFIRHAAPLSEPVDVYFNNRLVFRNLLQGTTTTFPASVPLGTYEVIVVRAGTSPVAQTTPTETVVAAPAPTETEAAATPTTEGTATAAAPAAPATPTDATAAAPAPATETTEAVAATPAQTETAPTAVAASNVLFRQQVTVSSAAPFTLALGGTVADGLSADLNSGDPYAAQNGD